MCLGEDDTAVVASEAKMMSDDSSDGFCLAANLVPESFGGALVLDGEKEVAFVFGG